jgi:hypothetical protein
VKKTIVTCDNCGEEAKHLHRVTVAPAGQRGPGRKFDACKRCSNEVLEQFGATRPGRKPGKNAASHLSEVA